MKKILKSIGNFFRQLKGKAYDFMTDNSILAVKVTNVLKDIVRSNVVDIAVTLTPTPADDVVWSKFKEWLPAFSEKVLIAHNLLQLDQGLDDPSLTEEERNARKIVVVNAFIDYLKSLAPSAQIKFWADIASNLLIDLEDGKLTWGEAAIHINAVYIKLYKS